MSAAEQLQPTPEAQEPVTVTMRVVPADPDHFAGNPGLKMGVPFFLKSDVTGLMENRMYYTGEHTDVFEFRRWFRKGMVYEPIGRADAVLFRYDKDLQTDNTPATNGD